MAVNIKVDAFFREKSLPAGRIPVTPDEGLKGVEGTSGPQTHRVPSDPEFHAFESPMFFPVFCPGTQDLDLRYFSFQSFSKRFCSNLPHGLEENIHQGKGARGPVVSDNRAPRAHGEGLFNLFLVHARHVQASLLFDFLFGARSSTFCCLFYRAEPSDTLGFSPLSTIEEAVVKCASPGRSGISQGSSRVAFIFALLNPRFVRRRTPVQPDTLQRRTYNRHKAQGEGRTERIVDYIGLGTCISLCRAPCAGLF